MRPIALALLLCAAPLPAASSPQADPAPPGPAPGAPEARAPGPLTLDDVLRRLGDSAPLARAGRARTEAAAAAAAKAARLPNPIADTRVENWRSGSDAHPFDASTDLDVFATLTQPLPVFGTHAAGKREAAALSRAAGADATAARNALLLEGARLYLATARGSRLESALAESRDALGEVVAMSEKRVASGWSAEGDLLKLRAELARAENLLTRIRLERDAAAEGLAALLGADRAVDPAALSIPRLPPLPDGDPEELARAGLASRPDVAAARERRVAADEVLRLEKARRIPEPALSFGYKRTGGLDTATAGLAFPLPLFDANATGVARAAAAARAAALEAEATERRAVAETGAALRAARALAGRARAAESELVRPAVGARQAARAAFREGASGVLPLVDAERVTAEAVREALDLEVEAHLRSLEARLALGQEVVP